MTLLNLQEILGDNKAEELKRNLDTVAQMGSSRVIGVWSSATGYAVVAEIENGRPIRWHSCGPMTIDDARYWLGSVESNLIDRVLQ